MNEISYLSHENIPKALFIFSRSGQPLPERLIEALIYTKPKPIQSVEEAELISIESDLPLEIRKLVSELKVFQLSSFVPSLAKANYKNKPLLDLLCQSFALRAENNPEGMSGQFTRFFIERAQ